jgi:hypothetical protein
VIGFSMNSDALGKRLRTWISRSAPGLLSQSTLSVSVNLFVHSEFGIYCSQITAMEGRRTADDHDMREVLRVHTMHELVEGLAKASLAVSHGNERVGLMLYNSLCAI